MNIKHEELIKFVDETFKQLQMTWLETKQDENPAEYQELTAKVRQTLTDIKDDNYETYIPDFMHDKIQNIKQVLNNKINHAQQIVNQGFNDMLLLKNSMEDKRNNANDANVTIKDKIDMNNEEYVQLNKIDQSFTEQLKQLIPVISQYVHKYYNKYLL